MSRRAGAGSSSALPLISRAEQIASGRLRMDRNPITHTRITDPSLAVGRRKEIDNVMKRARASSPGSWDRKLIEVEEKDPNRWRHTGYKQMYMDGGGTSGGSASPPTRRSRSRSPRGRRSPFPVVTTTTPHTRLSRERDRRDNVVTSIQRNRLETSQPVVSSSRDRDRDRERERERERDRDRERDKDKWGRAIVPRNRPPSPPPRRGGRSPSASSLSSCSDESCSVCSVKKHSGKQRSRSRSFSVPRSSCTRVIPPTAGSSRAPPPLPSAIPPQRRLTKPLNSGNANAGPSTLSLRRTASSTVPAHINTATTKKLKPSSGPPIPSSTKSGSSRDPIAEAAAKKRSRDEKVLEWQRTQLVPQKIRKPDKVPPSTPPSPLLHKDRAPPKLKTRIKKEDDRPKKKSNPDDKKSRAESGEDISPEAIVAALAGDSSGEDDSTTDDDSYQHQHHNENRLTLSERFGKMAQWSADRSNAIQNMRITRGAASDGGALTVRIEDVDPTTGEPTTDIFDGSPPHRFAHSPAPEGHYPDELLASAPGGLPSWDDVRVRYDYYKKRGYLRGLTLSDYVKWEEWWYRYQQWLKEERNYERWMNERRDSTRNGHRRRRQARPPDTSN